MHVIHAELCAALKSERLAQGRKKELLVLSHFDRAILFDKVDYLVLKITDTPRRNNAVVGSPEVLQAKTISIARNANTQMFSSELKWRIHHGDAKRMALLV